MRRTRELFERCFGGELSVREAETPLENFVIGVAWEWPKSAWYLGLVRGC
jgi:hypothetical protein